jgi:methylthioribose-1-phosphate isomerase
VALLRDASAGSSEALAAAFTPDGLPRALWWDDERGALCLIDQTRLPAELVIFTCTSADAVAEAIRTLSVRGAPAIGIAAAYGLALAAREILPAVANPVEVLTRLRDAAEHLRRTRPTAINLAWALERQLAVAERLLADGGTAQELTERLRAEADAIAAEDAAACRAMGQLGAELIADGDALLTHCNAGALATGGMGTALAPIYTAHRAGKRVHVYVDETRPVLQGARLTTWELARAGVPLTLITDNMAAHLLRRAKIRAIFVGADRVAANGDVANKIGTYGLAILARHHGVPFYVVAPRSTVDLALADGGAIPIEERSSSEVTAIGGVRIAPEGVRVANPAFDVTPAELVTAIITEVGVAHPPFGPALVALMRT